MIITDCEDHQQIAYMLGLSRPVKPSDCFATQQLSWMKELMATILDILSDEVVIKLII